MAVVEVEYNGVKGILVDGYYPSSFSFYKDKDWKDACAEKLPLSDESKRDFKVNIYKRFMTPGRKEPTPGPRSNFYRKMKGMLEDRFCQYGKKPCVQFQFPAVGATRMGLIVAATGKKNRQKVVPAFTKEIDHDLEAGKDTYAFHLIFLDQNKDNYCPSSEACAKNWREFMGFQVKKEEDYADFDSYKNAAEVMLKKNIEGMPYPGWF